MLSLTEWLRQVGFQGQNPFAVKQADQEGDDLQAYFVEHPAYNAILDDRFPHNTILHAPRGAGKSSSRRMFEQYCRNRADLLRPLLVELTDWRAIVDRAGSIEQLRLEHYIETLLAQTLAALAADEPHAWRRPPDDPDMAGYLNWLCLACAQDLAPKQRRMFHTRGWIVEQDLSALDEYHLLRLSPAQTLTVLSELLQAMGYQSCYIVIDRVDEITEIVAHWSLGARVLEPIIGNLRLIEIPGLAFKYFIPSEIVDVLRELGSLRTDRIRCFELHWSGHEGQTLLRELLQNRLRHFSDGKIESLASRATLDFRDIDEQLVAAAQGSPRRLLNLGELLFQACADSADDDNLLIRPAHLAAALQKLAARERREQPAVSSTASADPDHSLVAAQEPARLRAIEVSAAPPAQPAIPPLRIKGDGSIWRGDEEIHGWAALPTLQRRFLQYLYAHRGKLCGKEELLATIWQGKDAPTDEDALRKLAQRLIHFVEPDPQNPVYIKKIRGGDYCLLNTETS
jgi:DNA-binding response OmpR family regulator